MYLDLRVEKIQEFRFPKHREGTVGSIYGLSLPTRYRSCATHMLSKCNVRLLYNSMHNGTLRSCHVLYMRALPE